MEIDYLGNFDALITASLKIGNELRDKGIPKDNQSIYYAEGLAQKIVNHSITARHLLNGYTLKDESTQYTHRIDFCSILVLTRAALETYLAFNYVFVAGGKEDVRKFRFLCWNLGGYLDRAGFDATSEAHAQRKEEEKVAAGTLKSEISTNSLFQTLKEHNKQQILKGKWKIYQWHELAKMAGFNTRFFEQQYKFLCSHAHSSRLSVIQVQQNNTIEQQHEMVKSPITFLTIILAKYMYDYIELIPDLQNFKEQHGTYRLIQRYKEFGEKL